MDYLPYLLFPIFSSALLLGIGIYIWQFRRLPGAFPLGLGLIMLSAWSLLMALDYCSSDLGVKIFLTKSRLPFVIFLPVVWLIMAIQHSKHESQLKWRVIALLLPIPLFTCMMDWSNWSGMLFRFNFHLATGGPAANLLFDIGPWYWIQVIYSYGLLLASIGVLLHSLSGAQRIYSRQTWLIILATLLPMAVDFLFNFGITPVWSYQFLPAVLLVSGGLIIFSLLRFRMYDLVPIARSRVVENMADGVLVLDEKNHIVDINLAASRSIGLSAEKVIGEDAGIVLKPWVNLHALLHLSDLVRREITLGHAHDGKIYEFSITPVNEGRRPLGKMLLLRDMTEQKLLEDELRYLSFHDKMTGLYNRAYFEAEVDRLQQSRRFPISVIVADADNLKEINDTYGHAAGDQLLLEIAQALKQSFRPEDVVARIGGDEFGVLLPGTDAKAAQHIVDRVTETLKTGNPIEPDSPISMSIGMSTAKPDTELREAMNLADRAMYQKKPKQRRLAASAAK